MALMSQVFVGYVNTLLDVYRDNSSKEITKLGSHRVYRVIESSVVKMCINRAFK